MADLISDGGEFSCNFCTSKLKLTVTSSSSNGEKKKLANQTNCFFPPPGGNCTFPPGVPPTPCPGIPPGCVISTGQSVVKVDQLTALGDGCQFICPKGQIVSLSSAGQTKAKHDEASSGMGTKVVAGLAVVGAILIIALTKGKAGRPALKAALEKLGRSGIKKGVSKSPPKPTKMQAANGPAAPKSNSSTKLKKSRSGHPEPDPRADGRAHTVIEKPGRDGQYTTFNEDGTFKQYRGSGKPHGNIPRPNIKENRIDPRSPNGLPSRSTVRPAEPHEIP
jgi:hypothetical protein